MTSLLVAVLFLLWTALLVDEEDLPRVVVQAPKDTSLLQQISVGMLVTMVQGQVGRLQDQVGPPFVETVGLKETDRVALVMSEMDLRATVGTEDDLTGMDREDLTEIEMDQEALIAMGTAAIEKGREALTERAVGTTETGMDQEAQNEKVLIAAESVIAALALAVVVDLI